MYFTLFVNFLSDFLFVTLTKDALALFVCSHDIFSGVVFAYSYQFHSTRQVAQDFLKICFDVKVHYFSSFLSAPVYSYTSIICVSARLATI